MSIRDTFSKSFTKSILNERDREILDEYEKYTEINEPDDMADYIRALGRLVISSVHYEDYHIGKVQTMMAKANGVEGRHITVEEAKEWLDEFEVDTS